MIEEFDDEIVEDCEYISETKVKSIIKKLLFEIEKLKDENDSLWIMLEQIEQTNIDGSEIIANSLLELKMFKKIMKQKPEEA